MSLGNSTILAAYKLAHGNRPIYLLSLSISIRQFGAHGNKQPLILRWNRNVSFRACCEIVASRRAHCVTNNYAHPCERTTSSTTLLEHSRMFLSICEEKKVSEQENENVFQEISVITQCMSAHIRRVFTQRFMNPINVNQITLHHNIILCLCFCFMFELHRNKSIVALAMSKRGQKIRKQGQSDDLHPMDLLIKQTWARPGVRACLRSVWHAWSVQER